MTIAREWGRLGVIGFGGPPAHIALLRQLCVADREWLAASEFEDGVAACNLLPGPASTQLAIFCAWRLRGIAGAVLGGVCFIAPGLAIIIGLSLLFFSGSPPSWVRGAAEGAGAAVPVVAVNAALSLLPGSWKRTRRNRGARVRWAIYIVLGGVAAATIGPEIVIVLAACGLVELILRPKHGLAGAGAPRPFAAFAPFLALTGVGMGGLLALAWVAVKVGALSYGGGFVIVPLMQHDAVTTYHWMNGAQFLTAVALGQITPGPVVQTVAVVGYAAAGVGGALLAALVAFTPSFVFVIGGAPHFDRLRTSAGAQGFLTGAGAATIGAIAGSAIPLGLELGHVWQSAMLALAVIWLLVMRKGVVPALVGCGVLGVVAALAGAPVGH